MAPASTSDAYQRVSLLIGPNMTTDIPAAWARSAWATNAAKDEKGGLQNAERPWTCQCPCSASTATQIVTGAAGGRGLGCSPGTRPGAPMKHGTIALSNPAATSTST